MMASAGEHHDVRSQQCAAKNCGCTQKHAFVCDAANSMLHLCSNSRPRGSTDAIGNVHICGPFQAVQRMAMLSKRRCHILETWRLAVCPLTVVSCARACPGCVGTHCQRAQQGCMGRAGARTGMCTPEGHFCSSVAGPSSPAGWGGWGGGFPRNQFWGARRADPNSAAQL